VLKLNPQLRTVRSPYDDGEELVAMPALELDVAFVHMNRADAAGNGQYLGVDPYFDDLFCMAAKKRFVTCERLVRTDEFLKEGTLHTLLLNRTMVDGVIETPRGAHFTECPPDYGRDEAFQREYAASAKDAGAWQSFFEKYLSLDSEAAYQRAVAAK
jgi:glutaconate CoA-transferase subunit A